MDERQRRREEAAAFLRGDPDQLASIGTAVRLAVRSFRFGDRDLEEDLAQETLSRVLESLSERRFRGEASLRTYASGAARYTCLEHIRRRRWEVEIDAELLVAGDRWSAPEASYLWTEEHLSNLEAFAALPADCRTILRLVCVDGVSYRDLAARMGLSEAALKSRIHRCRLTCRESSALARRSVRTHPREGDS